MHDPKRIRYTIVSYFALFFLLFYFILVLSCKECWFWPRYNPYFFALALALAFTYVVFLVIRKYCLILEDEEERIEKLEQAIKSFQVARLKSKTKKIKVAKKVKKAKKKKKGKK